MTSVPREVPDRIWWCFNCNGGVGVWGVIRDTPPPRCPGCHAFDFAEARFVPDPRQTTLVDEVTAERQKTLAILVADSKSPCNCHDCDGEWCNGCLEHHGKKTCPIVKEFMAEISGEPEGRSLSAQGDQA